MKPRVPPLRGDELADVLDRDGFCPGFVPQPGRYISQRKWGLIQLMRSYENSPPKEPCSAANRPMAGQ